MFPYRSMLLIALLSSLGLASCQRETRADNAPGNGELTERTPRTRSQSREPFPQLAELELERAVFANSAPLQLGTLHYRKKSEKSATLLSLEVVDQSRFAVLVNETTEERRGKNDPKEIVPVEQVEKEVLYGLRGLIELSETHKRTVADKVEDHWRNRITSIVKAEGALFPISFANTAHLVFDSEMQNLLTGDVTPMTNDYELTVVEVLEANEYLARMPFEQLEERIRNRVYVVELRWTFGPRDGRQVTENQTFFYSTDLGFTVPCCDSELVRHQIDDLTIVADS